MKKIYLCTYKKNPKHKDLFAMVDDDQYESLSKYNWHYMEQQKGFFYACRNVFNEGKTRQKKIRMHCEVMGNKYIDHKDHNGLNNQKENLRESCSKTNGYNRKQQSNLSGGYKGVSLSRNKFKASIKINGNHNYLGTRDNPKDAARLYNDAALKYFGEFAYINKID